MRHFYLCVIIFFTILAGGITADSLICKELDIISITSQKISAAEKTDRDETEMDIIKNRFYSKKRKNTKSLKKLFNEAGIPAHERNSIAVLRDGENVIWIDGFGTDGKYLPDINTKNVLIIKKEG